MKPAKPTRAAARSPRGTPRSLLRRLLLALAGVLLLALPAASAAARDAAPLNPAPTIDRDRADRHEPAIPRPSASSPTGAPRKAVVEEQASAGTLAHVRFAGSSLPGEALDRATAPFLGRPLTRETLQRLANAVTAAYARSGVSFYSVTVPRQVVKDGALLVQVREGRIIRYAVRKPTASTPTRLIADYMDRLMADRPTHKRQLERTLSLLRDVPGQTVDAQLRTTARPDELFLDLDVKRKQVEIALELDNNGVTNVTSGVQAQLSVGLNGVLREGDSTRVATYLPFEPHRYQFYSLSHTTPLDANGTTLGLSAAHVRTRTQGTDIRGTATQAGLTVSHPLIRSYRRNLSLSLSLDGIDSDNYFLDTAFGGFRTRVVRASATWSWLGATGRSGYAVSVTASQGLDALGARAFVGYSEAGFTKANLQATGVKALGRRGALKITARGQYSQDRLPTTERFSLGGEGAGIAFRLGEVTADRALAGSAELSWKVLGPAGGATGAGGLTAFAYADGALGHSRARPVFNLPARDYALASAGGGLRIGFREWEATARVAVPVKTPAAFVERKTRFLFSIARSV